MPTPLPESLAGALVTLTPTTAADAPELHAIHASPAVAAWWDEPSPGFPMSDEPEAARLTIRHEGRIVGLVEYHEEDEPKYRSAAIDIFVDAAVHGRGIGTEAVRLVVDHLLGTGGHHRITIDPAAHNHAAVRAYAKAGFTPVGILRLAERDADGRGWHDALLMELVVEPGPPA